MFEFLRDAFAAIPTAASSKLAFLSYIAAIAVWAIIIFRARTLAEANKSVRHLKPADRLEFLVSAFGNVRTQVFLPEEYLRLKRLQYIFYAFLAVCATAVVVSGIALKDALDKNTLTDDLIESLLEPPSTDFASAVNVLNNGPLGISQFAERTNPAMNAAELAAIVAELQAQGLKADDILAKLRGQSGAAQLQDMNQQLLRVASRINAALAEIAECFQQQRCINSASKMPTLCMTINRVLTDARLSNEAALSVPGITFAESGSEPLFGDGALDLFFEQITIPNATFISRECV